MKYSYYNNVFLAENTTELLENTGMNKHTIELEEGKQPLFEPIYSLKLVELKTLKTYIEISLANGFIRPFKFSVRASILFDKNPDRSFRFYIDYWGLNNITIKNQYSLSLIDKSLDRLSKARKFT